MSSVLRWVARNAPSMVLALILSVLAWLVAVESEDPTRTGRFPQSVGVALEGLSPEMVLLKDFDKSVQITLRTTESVWQNLSADDFTVTADVSGLGPGTHQVPLQVTLDKSPARLLEIQPDTVTVVMDARAQRTVPVQVDVEGEPALGYIQRALVVSPQEVVVSGPESYVSQVVEAQTPVSIQDALGDVAGTFTLRPRDGEGQLVTLVSLSPETAEVRVPIELSAYYKPLPVKVVITGEVAINYRVTGISVTPPTITIFGSPARLSEMPGFIETVPVSVEGAEADVVARPELALPADVAVVASQQPIVRIAIDPIESSRTVEVTPTIQGLSPELEAKVPLENVEVILSGPLPMLQALEPGDVRVVLDLFGLSVGSHQIQPQVIVPEGISVQDVLPATLQISIASAQTPTPTSTITSTVTIQATAPLTE
ncbi:MAG: hypothetical protein GX601_03675 [Anaerolineales bacterium]|nr:hypothetical protein [Anaerolineales bacterium]